MPSIGKKSIILAPMKIHDSISDVSLGTIKKPILTVGTFDGLHIGHQKIIKRICEIAKQENGESVLLTFHPHPRLVLFPEDDNIKLICTKEEKIALLKSYGLDHVIFMKFGKTLSRMAPVEYVRDILVNKIGVSKFVIGYDHHFGRNRQGNIELLKELSPIYDFELEEIPAQEIEEIKVSSTKIRNAILKGDIAKAEHYLDHPFELSGNIIAGNQLGRTINFPTANVEVSEKNKIIPKNGVYQVDCFLEGKKLTGVLNIGTKPTTGENNKRSIEVHLLDFDELIYDKVIAMQFVNRIRDEKKFNSLDELKLQIKKDVQEVRNNKLLNN
ncbi:MAG: riboflavin kinase/FMN adenylyltransferase [Parvicella sp.]